MARERKQFPHLHSSPVWKNQLIDWIKSDWFCHECGAQNVWQEADAGEDYYIGCAAKCFDCGTVMWSMDKLEE